MTKGQQEGDETEMLKQTDVGYLEEVSKSYNMGRIYEFISMRMMMNI